MSFKIGSIVKIRGEGSIGEIVQWTNTDLSEDARLGLKLEQIAIVNKTGELECLVACAALLKEATDVERDRYILSKSLVDPNRSPQKTGIGAISIYIRDED